MNREKLRRYLRVVEEARKVMGRRIPRIVDSQAAMALTFNIRGIIGNVIRQKRSDTRVDTVENQYGINLNARGDMLLGNLLEHRGFVSLTQMLVAYRGKLSYHARKRRLFLTFHAADQKEVNAFRQLASDPAVDVEFYDGSLQQPVNSERSEYIKKILRRKISGASVAVCLIGNGTGWRDWVDWELCYAVKLRKGVCGVRLPNSFGRRPPLLADIDAPVAGWDATAIISAIECAAARRS